MEKSSLWRPSSEFEKKENKREEDREDNRETLTVTPPPQLIISSVRTLTEGTPSIRSHQPTISLFRIFKPNKSRREI